MSVTESDCRIAIRVISRFDGDECPDHFTIKALEKFWQVKRSNGAEWSTAHLSRMVNAASDTHGLGQSALLKAATSGWYTHDWRKVISAALEHGRRQNVLAEEKLSRKKVPLPPASGTGGAWSRPSSGRNRRQTISSSITLSSRPSTARTLRADDLSTNKFDDESLFRTENGRRKLFLPIKEHPPWSRHAATATPDDHFDDILIDAAGLTKRQRLSMEMKSLKEEKGRTLPIVHQLMESKHGLSCGTQVKLGRGVGFGAVVVELSTARGEDFQLHHRQRFHSPRKPELSDISPSRRLRGSTVAPTDATREALVRLVETLNSTC